MQITDEDIKILSECDGMMNILENAVDNLQMMPTWLHKIIVKAREMREQRNSTDRPF